MIRKRTQMEQIIHFDQDLLDLFSKLIEDNNEKLILELLFTKKDTEEIVDELIKELEGKEND